MSPVVLPDRPHISLISPAKAIQVERWVLLTIFDSATETMILCLPTWFVSKNQIKMSKKAIIVFVFSFRLLVAAVSIASTATYLDYLIEHKDFVSIAPTVALQEVLLGFSLLSASIPCLRSFLWAFMSTGLMTVYGSMPSVHLNNSNGPPLSSPNNLTRNKVRPSYRLAGDDSPGTLRRDITGYKCEVEADPNKSKRPSAPRRRTKDTSTESVSTNSLVIQQTKEVSVEHS